MIASVMQDRINAAQTFDDIIDAYQRRVLNIAFGFVHNREDAEDVTQEVFLQVYKSLDDLYTCDEKIAAWISRIAVTRSLDFIRRKTRKKRFSRLLQVFNSTAENPDQNRIEEYKDVAAVSPEEAMQNRERATLLYQTIERLPENQRVAFTLSKIDGMGNSEVAAVMELSLSAVESLIHRAKKGLREKLTHYYDTHL